MTARHRLRHLICLVSLTFGSAAGLGLLAAGSATAVPALAAPPAEAGALDGYITPGGNQHVDYIGTNGDIYELYYNGSRWIATNLNTAAGDPQPARAGALDGYITPGGNQHVDYIGTNGDIYELYYNGSRWIATDLNTAAG